MITAAPRGCRPRRRCRWSQPQGRASDCRGKGDWKGCRGASAESGNGDNGASSRH